MLRHCFGLIILVLTTSRSCHASFKVIREWNSINFTWPSVESHEVALQTGAYIPENNVIAGIKYFEDYFYITLPRMKKGVPATLARIPAGVVQDTAPHFEPYPSWEMNRLEDCNALQNVQNVEIDARGQIWIVDGGKTSTLDAVVMKCPPKLLVHDIMKNMTMITYSFPPEVANSNGSFLYDIVVDSSDGGYAYITDNGARDPGIIVYSVKDNHSWKIRHTQSMRADPNAVSFPVNGIYVTAPINIAGIALGPKIRRNNDNIVVDEDREVFYAPLSSLHLYSVNSSVLKNQQFATGEYQGEVKDYGVKQSQSNSMLMDNKGVLYYTLLATNSIAKWDTRTEFHDGQQIIAKDNRFLEWPASFTFDANGNLTILVNRLNQFIFGKISPNEPNFRLISGRIGGRSYLYDDNNYDYKSNMNDNQMQPIGSEGTVDGSSTTSTVSSSAPTENAMHINEMSTTEKNPNITRLNSGASSLNIVLVHVLALYIFASLMVKY